MHGLVGGLVPFRLRFPIVVGAAGKGDAPVRHGHLRVELGRAAEGSYGLVVIERIHKAKPLIEELLRLETRRRDGMMERAQATHEQGRHLRSARLCGVVSMLSVSHAGENEKYQCHQTREPHEFVLSSNDTPAYDSLAARLKGTTSS